MDKDEVDMMVEGCEDELPEEFREYLNHVRMKQAVEELAPQTLAQSIEAKWALPKSLGEWIKQDKKKDPN